VTGTGTGLKGQYYDNIDFTNLKLTRTDATVDFNFGSGSPDPSIGANTFSTRWTGFIEAKYNETYTFFTTSDDGVRLFVNGQQVINNFRNQSATEVSSTPITLQAGQKYAIRLDYYENTGQAVSKLAWSSATQAKQIIPQSQLYTEITPPTATANTTTLNTVRLRIFRGGFGHVETRYIASLQGFWFTEFSYPNRIATTLTSDGASEYTFSVGYNDNVGVNIASLDSNDIRVTGPNGFSQLATLVSIDSSTNGSPRTATYKINAPLTAWNATNNGLYTVALQSGQVSDTSGNFGNAGTVGNFLVSIAGTGTGLKGEYYDNIDFTNLKLTRTDPTINFDFGNDSPDPSIGVDTFSVFWKGRVEPKYSENYTFYSTTDDGVQVKVNGQVVIDKLIDQSPTTNSGSITLQAGQKYYIEIKYYENTGGAVAKLEWSSPTQAREIIPSTQFYLPVTIPTIRLGQVPLNVLEADGAVQVEIQRSGDDLSQASTVKYATTGETAFLDADFTAVSGTLTFAPGETRKFVTIY
jgi:hypothetical protein